MGGDLPDLGERWAAAPPAHWAGVVSAGTLAMYAFLGFEDMVNVAEEVKEVRRTLPRAIIWTLILTTLLYAMKNRDAKRGIACLCLGGGNAVALAVER